MISILQNEKNFQSSCYEMAKSNVSLAGSYFKSVFTGTFTHSQPTLAQLVLKAIPPQPAKPISFPLGLKNRCTNLVKVPFLLVRSPFLCMPLLNRVIQLALRCLSPRNPVDFEKSCFLPLMEAECEIRYKEDTRVLFVAKKYLEYNLQERKEFNPSKFKESSREDIQKLVDQYHKLSPTLTSKYINSCTCKKEEVKIRYSQGIRHQALVELIRELINDKTQKRSMSKQPIIEKDLQLLPQERAVITKLGFTTEEYFNACLQFLKHNPTIKCGTALTNKIKHYQN